MSKRILVILGHPNNDSFCGAIANSYIEGAKAAGNDVRRIAVGDLSFDPVLRKGYGSVLELEPDLAAAQSAIAWAQQIVFVYPIWWGAIALVVLYFLYNRFMEVAKRDLAKYKPKEDVAVEEQWLS